jgi:hypothetical protein
MTSAMSVTVEGVLNYIAPLLSVIAGVPLWAAHDVPGRAAALVLLAPVVRDPPRPTPWYGRAVLAVERNYRWF